MNDEKLHLLAEFLVKPYLLEETKKIFSKLLPTVSRSPVAPVRAQHNRALAAKYLGRWGWGYPTRQGHENDTCGRLNKEAKVADSSDMSVSAVSSPTPSSSLLSLLGSNSTSSSSTSALTSATSSSGDAVTVDLSNIAKAASSGDTASQATAVSQLKIDLATQQAGFLQGLFGDDSSSSSSDVGDNLLSSLYNSSSLSGLASQSTSASTAGTTINTTA